MGRGYDRRSVLLGAALLPLAACSADPAPPPPPPPVDPDDALRSAAVERERALLARYDAVVATQPALAPQLAAVREEHAEHLRALLGPDQASTGIGTAAPSDQPSPSDAPSPAPTAPADPAAALAELVDAEAAAGAGHAAAALEAGGELAGLLASLAASEASHRVVLA